MSIWKLTSTRSVTTLTTKEGIWMKVDDVIDWIKHTQGNTTEKEAVDLMHIMIKSLIRMKNQKV